MIVLMSQNSDIVATLATMCLKQGKYDLGCNVYLSFVGAEP